MDARRFRHEYKYIYYFLKELGILEEWKEYLKSQERNRPNINDPKLYSHIDRVFGKCDFTLYLSENYGIHFKFGENISSWFRAFLYVYSNVEIYGTTTPILVKIMREHKERKNFKEILIKKGR